MRRLTSLVIFGAAAVLTACGGGGGGGEAAPAPPAPAPALNNFKATALQVDTANPRIGYPLAVSVSITAEQGADEVAVSLFAVEKNTNASAVTRQIPLGTETLPRVEAGSRAYALAFAVPSSVELPGAYFLAAVVNPVAEIAESDDTDNIASVEAALARPSTPNILIKEAALDRSVLEVNTDSYAAQVPGSADNVYNADAAGTVTVGVEGLEVGQALELEAFAKLRITRSDRATSHDVPLYLWRSDLDRYTHAYGVEPGAPLDCSGFVCTPVVGTVEWLPLGRFEPQLAGITDGELALQDVNRDSTHLNYYFPGKLGSELEIAARHLNVALGTPTAPPPDLTPQAISELRSFLSGLPVSVTQYDDSAAMAVMGFAICIEIRPADSSVTDRFAADNEVCTPLTVMLPPRVEPPPVVVPPPAFVPRYSRDARPILAGKPFRTRGGGSAFGFGLEFAASSSSDNHGVTVNMGGPLTVTIFGTSTEFMKATVRAQLIPDASDYVNRPPNETSGFKTELRFAGALISALDLPPTSSPKLSVTFSKEKSKDYSAWVGPVPITGSASVSGNIGIEYQFVFTADATAVTPNPKYALGLSAGPFLNLEAGLSAGVGNSAFSAGVEGVLTLLDERLTVFSGSQIDVVDSGLTSGISEFVINSSPQVINEFTGPKGGLNLYAKYSVPAVRKCSWGFFTGLCPTVATLKATKEIWSSKALFHLRDVLYEDTDRKLDVVVARGQAPAYYAP